jgi:hypothetical protein
MVGSGTGLIRAFSEMVAAFAGVTPGPAGDPYNFSNNSVNNLNFHLYFCFVLDYAASGVDLAGMDHESAPLRSRH